MGHVLPNHLQKLYQPRIISPNLLKAAMSHIRNIMHIHAKKMTDTLSPNYWLVRATASSACPTATSW